MMKSSNRESQPLSVSFKANFSPDAEAASPERKTKTYDTFSQAGGVLFYNVPREGVNPFHGYSNVSRERAIYPLTKNQGFFVTEDGKELQDKQYGVPLRDDVIDTEKAAPDSGEDSPVVQDHWLSWRHQSAYHSKKYLPSSITALVNRFFAMYMY